MNDIRILPLYFYPFNRTQNQVMNSSLFEQGKRASTSNATSLHYNFNSRLGGMFATDDDEILETSLPIKAHTPLGEMTFDVNLSQDSFSFRYKDFNISQTMYDIKMLVFFKDYNKVSTGINKYFYYVEQVKRVNANNFTFTLSLDVFKTYYNDVMEIKELNPERYFIESENVRKSLMSKTDDIVLSYGGENQTMLSTMTMWKKPNSSPVGVVSRMVWEYWYFMDNQGIVQIICLPIASNDRIVSNGDLQYTFNKHPSLIKVVRSCVSPMNSGSTLGGTDDYIYLKDNNDYLLMDVKGAFNINQITRTIKGDILNNSIEDLLPSNRLDNYFIVIQLFQQTMKNIDEVNYFESSLYFENGDVVNFDFMNFNNNKYITNSPQILLPSLSLGFMNENKALIPYGNKGSSVGLITPKIKVVHSLFQTQDVIYYPNYKSELSIERGREFTNPKLTDAYETYILNNKNALIQKEMELNKFATRNTVVRGVVSTVVAGLGVAGAMLTGGGSIAVAGGIIAGGMSGYNMIDGLGKNARLRASHKAELDDKRGKIENFTPSNYNEYMPFDDYAPVLVSYKETTNLSNVNDIRSQLFNNPLDFWNYRMYEKYGLIYGLNDTKSVREMITRKHYNYLEVNDVMNATQNGNIPNNLYTHILDVLQNGITFSTIDYILNSNLRNEEV